jgi:hypothetical protein
MCINLCLNEVFIPFSRIICLTSSFHFLDALHYYDVVQHILSCYSIRIQIEISRRLSLLNKALLSPPQMEKVRSYKKLISRFDSEADKQWIVCSRIKKKMKWEKSNLLLPCLGVSCPVLSCFGLVFSPLACVFSYLALSCGVFSSRVLVGLVLWCGVVWWSGGT